MFDGQAVAVVARKIGPHEMTLRKWLKKEKESGPAEQKPLDAAERAELERLRAENTQLQMQVAFAKKVALVRARQAVKFGAIADWVEGED